MGAEPERDGDEQRRPLLSSSSPPLASVEQHQQHYKFLGRSSSFVLHGGGGGVGGLGWGGPEVSANDIRSAASHPIPSFRSTGHHPLTFPLLKISATSLHELLLRRLLFQLLLRRLPTPPSAPHGCTSPPAPSHRGPTSRPPPVASAVGPDPRRTEGEKVDVSSSDAMVLEVRRSPPPPPHVSSRCLPASMSCPIVDEHRSRRARHLPEAIHPSAILCLKMCLYLFSFHIFWLFIFSHGPVGNKNLFNSGSNLERDMVKNFLVPRILIVHRTVLTRSYQPAILSGTEKSWSFGGGKEESTS
ncbi:unnamed protein product [Urochloa humidicola]